MLVLPQKVNGPTQGEEGGMEGRLPLSRRHVPQCVYRHTQLLQDHDKELTKRRQPCERKSDTLLALHLSRLNSLQLG